MEGHEVMPLILDTNALLWLRAGDSNLGIGSRKLVDDALLEGQLFVSAFSFWEVGMLVAKGRLLLHWEPDEWRRMVLEMGIQEYAVSGDVAVLSTTLQGLPADPADRIIVATALHHDGMLLTADSHILSWTNNTLIRHNAMR